ncbi:hypothetical protein DL240_00110 [Lujinxingia litoralis]|uniref:GAF domain-containing protein n=1 Tax=Lujinxingia litoralis TaxID=2211119 RepID=A0A328C9M6_9DELT|nr:GAF domain-containing protein [Lujinxingia litoralis]RAL24648.1 hypothetical protein DL240_00110 [Lujinxingia litoralis]
MAENDAGSASRRFELSREGKEVIAFHLQSFLRPWMQFFGVERVLVCPGFEHSLMRLGAYSVSVDACTFDEGLRWDFHELLQNWRYGSPRLVWEAPGGGASVQYQMVEVPDRGPSAEGRILGFALVRADMTLPADALRDLKHMTAEALRVYRRNAVRLFFDERSDLAVKAQLYELMSSFAEWLGCDHSASILLSSSPVVVTKEGEGPERFDVLAERIFFEAEGSGGDGARRLVGMAIEAGGEPTLVSETMRRYGEDPAAPYHAFVRPGDDTDEESGQTRSGWRASDAPDRELAEWHAIEERPVSRACWMVPMLSNTRGEDELLGYVAFHFLQAQEPTPHAVELISEIASQLARVLRHSSMYVLGASKLQIVQEIRRIAEFQLRGNETGEAVINAYIAGVTALVAERVEVPSLAIGYVVDRGGERWLRYAHPCGWTRFDQLEIPIDVAPQARADSGISALAVRLARPVTLSGGHGSGEGLRFKNELRIHEESGRIADARSPAWAGLRQEQGWRRLSEYYKPARKSAYATLAFPVVYAGRALGVLTVEVERTTDWVWWSGLGGQLFWELVAGELAFGFATLGGPQWVALNPG